MINTLFVAAETAPIGLVLEHGVEQGIDGEGLS